MRIHRTLCGMLLACGIAFLAFLALYQDGYGQGPTRLMEWWSVPWGDQTTCGMFEQSNYHEWLGDKPDIIYFEIAGPETHDIESGIYTYHFTLLSIFPEGMKWEVSGGWEDPRGHFIVVRLSENEFLWSDAEARTVVPIGYRIRVHGLDDNRYVIQHVMVGTYDGDVTAKSFVAHFYAYGCYTPRVYLPMILKGE